MAVIIIIIIITSLISLKQISHQIWHMEKMYTSKWTILKHYFYTNTWSM